MQIGFDPSMVASSVLNGLSGGGAASTLTPPAGSSTQTTPFGDLLTDAVGQVNELETQAHQAVTGLMTGNGVDVHQAMIATQKANASFELALAVRNKAVSAYQTVMGMQF